MSRRRKTKPEEYTAVCPQCQTNRFANLIINKGGKRRYFCRNCCNEFEICSEYIAVYKPSASGQLYLLSKTYLQ